MWYKFDPTNTSSREEAEKRAWKHVEQVLARPTEAYEIEPAVGGGPLSGTGFFRRHGDPFEGYTFHVLPKRPDFLTRKVFRPIRDTLMNASDFCKAHEFVRRLPDGTEVYRCKGHELLGSGGEVLPEKLRDRPLKDKRLVEVFSGIESDKEAGAMLSRVAIFDKGIEHIDHYQHDNYYRCLLKLSAKKLMELLETS